MLLGLAGPITTLSPQPLLIGFVGARPAQENIGQTVARYFLRLFPRRPMQSIEGDSRCAEVRQAACRQLAFHQLIKEVCFFLRRVHNSDGQAGPIRPDEVCGDILIRQGARSDQDWVELERRRQLVKIDDRVVTRQKVEQRPGSEPADVDLIDFVVMLVFVIFLRHAGTTGARHGNDEPANDCEARQESKMLLHWQLFFHLNPYRLRFRASPRKTSHGGD